MEIRKISIGPDYKSGAMHYILGQTVLGGNHTIELIKHDLDTQTIKIYIREEDVKRAELWGQTWAKKIN